MRSLAFLFVGMLTLTGATDCSAQTEYEDVVYLMNGEIRRGMIIEDNFRLEQIKIKTKDGIVFVYDYDEIERKTKEKRFHVRPQHQPVPEYFNRKDPAAALALSAIPGFFGLNGGGQFYNGEIRKGIRYLVAGIAGSIFFVRELNNTSNYENDGGRFFAPAMFITVNWIHGMVDAYKSAKRINDRGVSIISTSNSNLSVGPALIGNKSLGLETRVTF